MRTLFTGILPHTLGGFGAYYVRGLAYSGLVLSGGDPHSAIEDCRTARSLRTLLGLVAQKIRLLCALILAPDGKLLGKVLTTLAAAD